MFTINRDYQKEEVYKKLSDKDKQQWDNLITAYMSAYERCTESEVESEEWYDAKDSMAKAQLKFDRLFHKKLLWFIKD